MAREDRGTLRHSDGARLRSGFVVVVSADDDVRDMYVQLLRGYRRKALGVTGLDQLLELGQQSDVGVVLFDALTLSDFDVCDTVARSSALSGAPVVVLTAWIHDDRRFRDRAEHAGCAAFVAKPCSPELVVSTLDRVQRGERGIEIVMPR